MLCSLVTRGIISKIRVFLLGINHVYPYFWDCKDRGNIKLKYCARCKFRNNRFLNSQIIYLTNYRIKIY